MKRADTRTTSFVTRVIIILVGLFCCTQAVGQTWIQLTPVAPGGLPPLVSPVQLNYDAVNNRLITFFAGNPLVDSSHPNEVWILTNANGLGGTPTWTLLASTGTPPNTNGNESVTYDPINNILIVYGGCYGNCDGTLTDVAVLSNANGLGGTPVWTHLTVTNPQSRDGHTSVYDSATQGMISFGGGYGYFGTDQNDTRILTNANGLVSPSTWNTLSIPGTLPGVREGHSAVYDQTNHLMTIFGGADAIACCYNIQEYNDAWVLSNANGQTGNPAWTLLTPSGTLPPGRGGQAAVYDTVNNRMIVFGGNEWSNATQSWTALNDLWQLSNANGLGGSPAWTSLTSQGTPPGPSPNPTAVFDSVNQRMILLPGVDPSGNPTPQLWILALPSSNQANVVEIGPNQGGNAGNVTMNLYGSGFAQGTTVNLACGGQSNIPGTNVVVGPGGTTLTATFNLQGITPGKCDVVVTNSSGTSVTDSQAFTVEQGGAPQVWVDVIGQGKIRIGSPTTFYVVVGNNGSVDAPTTRIWVAFPSYIIWDTPGQLASVAGQTQGSEFVGFDTIPGVGSSTPIPITLQVQSNSSFQVQAWKGEQ